jgi:hypothetical protein
LENRKKFENSGGEGKEGLDGIMLTITKDKKPISN